MLKLEITEKNISSQKTGELILNFVKIKMKNFKESNINLMKCIVDMCNFITIEMKLINKRIVYKLMPFYIDKIGNINISHSIKSILLDSA